MKTIVLLLAGLMALQGPAAAQALSCSDQATCLRECQNTLGKSRSECRRLLNRLQIQRPPAPSVAVQPPTRSKYKPVPQGNGGSTSAGGLYRNTE